MISKYINSGGFAIILLCFLLPLVSIKCQQSSYSLITFYGYDFLMGKSYEVKDDFFNNPFKTDKNKEVKQTQYIEDEESQELEQDGVDSDDGLKDDAYEDYKSERDERNKRFDELKKGNLPPNPYMIFIAALALGGFILALSTNRSKGGPSIVLAAGIAICLIIFSLTLKGYFNMKSSAEFEVLKFMFRFSFEIGYWLMLISAIGLIIYNAVQAAQKFKPVAAQPTAPVETTSESAEPPAQENH